jgi:hypothetical protein
MEPGIRKHRRFNYTLFKACVRVKDYERSRTQMHGNQLLNGNVVELGSLIIFSFARTSSAASENPFQVTGKPMTR